MGFISDLLIEITSFRIRVGNKLNKLWEDIGNKASLTTTNKSNLVNAINETNNKFTDFGGVNLAGDSHFYNGNTNGWNNAYGTQVVENHIYKKTFTTLSSAARIERVFPNLKAGIYTLTIFVKTPVAISWYSFVNGIPITGSVPSSPNEFARRSVTFNVPNDGNVTVRGYVPSIPVGSVIEIDWFKLETGYVGSDWTPILEEQKSDWNETNPFKDSYIKNKPEIPTPSDYITTNTNQIGLSGNKSVDGTWTFNNQINTANHGNSSQWKQAYDWGDFRGYGLARQYTSSSAQQTSFSNIDSTYVTRQYGVTGSFFGIVNSNRPQGWLIKGATTDRWSWMGVTDLGPVRIYATNYTAVDNYVELYHTGNFNPAQYVLQSSLNTQLANYVPINGVTTINNTKTFTSSPIVPNATLNGHAVNLGQLNTILGDYATEEWVNQQGFVTSDTTYSGSASIILLGTSFQRAALTGDVTASQNSNTTTIASNAVTNTKMALMNANSIKGRAGSIGNPQDLTPAQVRTMLNIQEGANRTRIGINGGNYTEVGDINLIAGSNVSLSKSGENITINSASQPIDTTVKLYMPGEVVNNDTVSCNASKTIIYLSPTFTGPLNIAIDPELQDGAWLIVIHTYQGSGPGLFNINGSLIDITAQLTSTYQASQGKRYRFIYVKDLGRFALVDGGGIYQ